MAYPRFNQPLITSPTGLRLPAPSRWSPLYSSGFDPNQTSLLKRPSSFPSGFEEGGVVGPRGSPTPFPRPPPGAQPKVAFAPGISSFPSVATPAPKLEVSPYMETMYKSIQNIDPEQREEYLSTTAASIKDRLDRYEFRIARGIPLTPEQQRQYDSIRNAYNDIQKYINNSAMYDDYFSGKLAQAAQPAKPSIQYFGR